MAEQKKSYLRRIGQEMREDLNDKVNAMRDSITGLVDRDKGPLVQGPIFGSGHVQGMVRLGMAELRQAASFGAGSAEQPTPPGIFGSPTQGEIARARGGPGAGPEQDKMSMDQFRSHANDQAKEKEQRKDRGRDKGGMEM